jgi:hypothetical protein
VAVVGRATGRRNLSEVEVAQERRRLEQNPSNEVSLTSFKHLAGGGDL